MIFISPLPCRLQTRTLTALCLLAAVAVEWEVSPYVWNTTRNVQLFDSLWGQWHHRSGCWQRREIYQLPRWIDLTQSNSNLLFSCGVGRAQTVSLCCTSAESILWSTCLPICITAATKTRAFKGPLLFFRLDRSFLYFSWTNVLCLCTTVSKVYRTHQYNIT
jgi:hypothetical protein